jgi:1,3-beta-glucan synthase
VFRSVNLGLSAFTPWKNVFVRMPRRLFAKLLAVDHVKDKSHPDRSYSALWNAIIFGMYRDHLIAATELPNLLYKQSEDVTDLILEPKFFLSQEDASKKGHFFPQHGEAARRLGYLAQSLYQNLFLYLF